LLDLISDNNRITNVKISHERVSTLIKLKQPFGVEVYGIPPLILLVQSKELATSLGNFLQNL
jgi:hypothetical protein